MAASEPRQGSTRRSKLPSFKPFYCQLGPIIRRPERGEPGGSGGFPPRKKAHTNVPTDRILKGKDENPILVGVASFTFTSCSSRRLLCSYESKAKGQVMISSFMSQYVLGCSFLST
jgi:hypothetical protein